MRRPSSAPRCWNTAPGSTSGAARHGCSTLRQGVRRTSFVARRGVPDSYFCPLIQSVGRNRFIAPNCLSKFTSASELVRGGAIKQLRPTRTAAYGSPPARGRQQRVIASHLRKRELDFASRSPLLFLLCLGLVPQRIHLGERRLARRLAPRLQRALDRAKAALEFLIGGAQHRLRIGIEMAREVDDRKQQVARLGSRLLAVATYSDRGFDLVSFLSDLRQHRHRIVPVEAHLAGLLLQLERAGEGRQADRNARQR